MNDLVIAGILMAFLIGLAMTAPIWGVDSRDGIESDEPSRRGAWLHGRNCGPPAGPGRSASILLAGALRAAATRLDGEVTARSLADQRLVKGC